MAEYLNFSKGISDNLHNLSTFTVGTIYVCTDNGKLYLGVADNTTDENASVPTTETLLEITGEDCGESSDSLTWAEWPHNRDVYVPETYTFSGTYHASNFNNGLKSLNNPKLLWNQEIEIETEDMMSVDGLPNINKFKLSIDLRNDKYYITFYESGSTDESEYGVYKYSLTDNTVPSITFSSDSISVVSDYVRPVFENYFSDSEPTRLDTPHLFVKDGDILTWQMVADASNVGAYELYYNDGVILANLDTHGFYDDGSYAMISLNDFEDMFGTVSGKPIKVRACVRQPSGDVISSDWSNEVTWKHVTATWEYDDMGQSLICKLSEPARFTSAIIEKQHNNENVYQDTSTEYRGEYYFDVTELEAGTTYVCTTYIECNDGSLPDGTSNLYYDQQRFSYTFTHTGETTDGINPLILNKMYDLPGFNSSEEAITYAFVPTNSQMYVYLGSSVGEDIDTQLFDETPTSPTNRMDEAASSVQYIYCDADRYGCYQSFECETGRTYYIKIYSYSGMNQPFQFGIFENEGGGGSTSLFEFTVNGNIYSAPEGIDWDNYIGSADDNSGGALSVSGENVNGAAYAVKHWDDYLMYDGSYVIYTDNIMPVSYDTTTTSPSDAEMGGG